MQTSKTFGSREISKHSREGNFKKTDEPYYYVSDDIKYSPVLFKPSRIIILLRVRRDNLKPFWKCSKSEIENILLELILYIDFIPAYTPYK